MHTLKSEHSLRKKLAVIATIAATVTTSVTAVNVNATPVGSETTNTTTASTPSQELTPEEQQLTDELANGFETLFTEVLKETPEGDWAVDYAAAARYGISREEVNNILAVMQDSSSQGNLEEPTLSTMDMESFGKCVLWEIAPVPISPSDARALGELLHQKRWRDAARKVVQVAALNGATSMLRKALATIGGPVALAAELAVVAGSCLLSEHLD